jgi:hypothetical protein
MRQLARHIIGILEESQDDLAHLIEVIAGGLTFGVILGAAYLSIWALAVMLR